MFEFELWRLRQQLDRINQHNDRMQEHMDSIKALDRKEAEKIERQCEESRRLFEAPTPPTPPTPAPLPTHALMKSRVLAGLRGTAAPPARDEQGRFVPPNTGFAELKQKTLAGLRGGR